jgi:hypothetical protein
VIARALVLVAAVAGLVLLAGDLRVARDVDRAAALADRPAEAVALLRRAGGRTADTTPLLREAQLHLFLREPDAALGPAREAVRREPGNAQAWLVVARPPSARATQRWRGRLAPASRISWRVP